MQRGIDEGIFLKNGQKSTLHCLKEKITKPGVCTPAHFHKYNEILYGIDCDISVWIDDELEHFKSGDLCFIHQNETHFMYSEKELNTYYVIKFSPEILSYDGQTLSEMRYLLPILRKNEGISHIISGDELQTTETEALFKTVFEEWESEKTGYEFAIRGEILRLFSMILRVWEKSGKIPLFKEVNDENIIAIHHAAAYIAENSDAVNEKELSELFHMSYSHFSRTFKKVMGRSFSQFVCDVRIDCAKRLLITTSKSVTEISQQTGFSTASHFISSFKARTGMTPYTYKNSLKTGSGS